MGNKMLIGRVSSSCSTCCTGRVTHLVISHGWG